MAALPEDDVDVIHGVRVSKGERLFVELASSLPLLDLVALGDWLVRQSVVTPESLVDSCAGRHVRYAARAREAASYVRAGVDSRTETRLRLLLRLAGLPEPVVAFEVRDEFGSVVLRLDLAYPSVRLAVEYDGRQHLESGAQWERDVERRDDLASAGWRLLTVTSRGLFREPASTVERVHRALREQGWPGLRPVNDAWRPHFGL